MVSNIEINLKDSINATPLYKAVKKGLLDTVRILLEFRADASSRDNNNNLLIHLVALGGYKDVVCRLIVKEYINARGFYRRTALHYATKRGHIDLVQVFLDYSADANIIDS
jgi:ankyrin repeat protein